MKTFKNWPLEFITPQQLVKSGFIFTGDADMVKCVFCHFECNEWVEGDDPTEDHRNGSPGCPFITFMDEENDGSICNLYLMFLC